MPAVLPKGIVGDDHLIEFEHTSMRFGPVLALDDVSIGFDGGSVHALLGENGAGKSTLLGILAGSQAATGGTLRIGGEPVDPDTYTPHRARDLGVGVVFQEQALVPSMSVTDNVFLGREIRRRGRLERGAMRRRAAEALERLGAAHIPVDARVEHLSVAQAQLVEIARAIAFDTKVVALDEPSAVLAGHELESLFEVVEALRDQGVGVIYVSHRLDEVFRVCDRYTVLKDGRVTGTGSVADTTTDEIIRLMVGRDIDDIFPERTAPPGDALLRVRGASLAGVLDDISFDAHAGEILGIAGLIGSGRTTLGKALFGAVHLSAGTVTVANVEGPFHSPRQALAAGLAYLPEDRKAEGLALDKTVRANVSMLSADAVRSRTRLVSRSKEIAVVARMLGALDVRTSADGSDRVDRLSGGNQQKVVIAKWLLAGPRVLVLDEPTRGIDIGAKAQIYALLRRLADEGHAIVVISSELIEIVGLCDRVLVLSAGSLRGELPAEEVSEESIMRLATPVGPEAP